MLPIASRANALAKPPVIFVVMTCCAPIVVDAPSPPPKGFAGFSAWRQMMTLSGSPLARAVRMKFERSTSSIDERISRAIEAM